MHRTEFYLLVLFICFSGCATTPKSQQNFSLTERQQQINSCLAKGVSHYNNNNLAKSKKEFQKLFSILNVNAEITLIEKSDPGFLKNEVQEYISDLEPALLERTAGIQALYAQGEALYKIGQYKQAIEYFAKILVLDPNFKDTIGYIMEANIELQKIKEEEESERKNIAAKEYYKNALTLYRRRMLYEAAVEFRKVLDIDPAYGKAKEYLDKISIKLFDTAKKYYKQGLSLYSDGDIEQAIELWEEALKLAPEYPEAQKALERAKTKIKE